MQTRPPAAIPRSFESIGSVLPLPMLLLSTAGYVLAANEAAAQLLGREKGGLIGRPLSEVANNSAATIDRLLADTLQRGGMMLGRLAWPTAEGAALESSVELYALGEDDGSRYVLLRILPEGNMGGYTGYLNQRIHELSRQLDEKRHHEESLRESQERFHRAQQAARLGTWDWDLVTGTLIWDGVEAVHGREPGSFDQTFESYTRDIHPADRARVLEAIHQLSARQKQVILLRYYHDLTLPEIAKIMKCTEGAVKRHLFRAQIRLRLLLKDVEGDEA